MEHVASEDGTPQQADPFAGGTTRRGEAVERSSRATAPEISGESVMNQGRVIRLPVHVVRELQQVLRARRTLENDLAFAAVRNGFAGEGVRVEDVAARLGRDMQDVAELLAMAETPRSLDAAMERSDDEHTLGNSMADELAVDPTGVTQNHEIDRLLRRK